MNPMLLGIIDSLDVSDNDIHDAALAQLLQKWAHQLRELDLSLNTVGLKATSCLVQALSAPAAIMQVIKCDVSDLASAQVMMAVDTVSWCLVLQELNLSHSQLTSEQLELLGEGLAYNASLLRLNLVRRPTRLPACFVCHLSQFSLLALTLWAAYFAARCAVAQCDF